MKRIITIVCALLLVLGLSQCKKKPVVTDNGPKPVSITLDVNGGSKVLVNTSNGEVTFEDGDVIYVAYQGVYVGYLTYITEVISSKETRSYFSGDINISATNDTDHLYFYFLGNKTPDVDLTVGLESLSVDIVDQTSSSLPVISAAASNEAFSSDRSNYSAILENKCALVKFSVTSDSADEICISGLNNKVTVDFSLGDNGFSYGKVGNSVIRLNGGVGSYERWAILLPQTGINCTAYSADYSYSGSVGDIIGSHSHINGRIEANDYVTYGVSISMTAPFNVLEGAIKCLYSVSSTKQVFFSQGNLQYQASTDTWRFANKQNHYVGGTIVSSGVSYEYGNVYENEVKCDNGLISSDYTGWIDLFGYGTSGLNGKPPYTSSNNNADYPSSNISDTDSDWGRNNISNGGNIADLWRTLTTTEWIYLFNNYRFVLATVGDVKGLLLLPEFWEEETYSLNNIKYPNYGTLGLQYNDVRYSDNIIPYDDFHNYLEVYGAVFFPAAGKRVRDDNYGDDCTTFKSETSTFCFSSTIVKGNLRVVSITPIDKTDRYKFMSHNGVTNYYEGRSVRLVTDYN